MTDLESIKRKLRGILAKAGEGSGATEAEAEAALEFARRLMLRHQLTESDLGGRNRTPSEIAADTEYGTVEAHTTGAALSTWEWRLACAITGLIGTIQAYRDRATERRSATGCLEFGANGKPKKAARVVFFGPAEDCADARELFEEWSVLVAGLARMRFGGALRGPGRSYAEGFCAGLQEVVGRMRERERALIGAGNGAAIDMRDAALVAANETENGSACTALVVAAAVEVMRAKHDRCTDWLHKERGLRLRSSSRSGGRNYGDAFAAGKRDGQRADFSRSVKRKLR